MEHYLLLAFEYKFNSPMVNQLYLEIMSHLLQWFYATGFILIKIINLSFAFASGSEQEV
jgi:hypothetical protein